MGSLDVYYAPEHGERPVKVETPEQVDALIDRLRAESSDDVPILMQLYVSDDIHGQELSAGVRGNRGVLRYAGRDWFEGVYSVGGAPVCDDAVLYFYMGNDTEFPSDAEIDLDAVRNGVKEYLATDGARPHGVVWRPDH